MKLPVALQLDNKFILFFFIIYQLKTPVFCARDPNLATLAIEHYQHWPLGAAVLQFKKMVKVRPLVAKNRLLLL